MDGDIETDLDRYLNGGIGDLDRYLNGGIGDLD